MKPQHATALLAGVAVAAILAAQPSEPPHAPTRPGVIGAVEMATVAPGVFAYRMPGEFLRGGRPVDGPMKEIVVRRPVEIMAYQVSVAEYAACVAEAFCAQADIRRGADGDRPVTGVSYRDATAYAAWVSWKTGDTWRLPTDAEWAFAAAERFGDDALGLDDSADPAARWLSAYRNRGASGKDTSPLVRGAGGSNSNGLRDIGGNVWEWTETCYERASLDEHDSQLSATTNCGVRILGGRHRSYMSDFIRDGKSGGCAAGVAPENLGFRLVREPAPALGIAFLRRAIKALRG